MHEGTNLRLQSEELKSTSGRERMWANLMSTESARSPYAVPKLAIFSLRALVLDQVKVVLTPESRGWLEGTPTNLDCLRFQTIQFSLR